MRLQPSNERLAGWHHVISLHQKLAPWFASAATFAALCAIAVADDARIVVNAERARLGDAEAPEWEWFENDRAKSAYAEFHFDAQPNAAEATLFIRQADVKLEWRVALNGRALGKLFLMEEDLVHTLPIPPGVLREKDNVLTIATLPGNKDDIVLGDIRIEFAPVRAAIAQSGLQVQVRDDRGESPARITVADFNGTLVPLVALQDGKAARPGVVYTGTGRAALGLRPGKYTIYASRGFEYSVASQTVDLRAGEGGSVVMQIHREVPVSGMVSCDTHIHTLTLSGHGDSTLDERMLTIAGEGIELPVATEHNQHADYAEAAGRMGVARYFTPVRGNEVTTSRGHFNIFPVDAGAAVPDAKLTDWKDLLAGMRHVPGVQVVLLNHPRSIHTKFRPFDPQNFNTQTGENPAGLDLSFDAMELVNSGAQQTDSMLVIRDWFALLNRGHRIVGIGASDSHDVSRFIVGQARTYITAPDDDPGQIDIGLACKNLRAGKAIVSMGLLPEVVVEDRFRVGDLATGLPEVVRVVVRVSGPSWVKAEKVELFANGERIQEGTVSADRAGVGGEKTSFTWTIPRPQKDTHLIAVATGPAVTAPFWAMSRPYQPTSPKWTGRSIGITNPVWLDADGDGRFTAINAAQARTN